MKRAAITVALVLAAAAGGVWWGRRSVPARVETKTIEIVKTVEVEKRVEVKVQGPVRVRVTTREVPGPQGPERIVVREVEKGPVTTTTNVDSTSTAERQTEASKLVLQQPRWMVGAKAGIDLSLRPAYGAEAKYRLAGPLWVGVEANTRGRAFASLSLTF